ncbi:hypothetical protein [Actinomadura flavalba]|uniref:hypothetical protein n=1 Tax=Actinomadura flavalba TaxID=1120938 RepID=UPI0003680763|nr:hypothetical protein [Actinomadura flavalba]
MNPTDRQRKLLFAGLVVALAGIGVYLTIGPPAPGEDDASPRPSVSAGPPGPASPPPGIAGSVGTGSFDIYRLLPFSQREFASAAALAQNFIAAYSTHRFDEEPAAYMARLNGFVTADLRGELQRASATPGLLEKRREDREVAQGGATLDRVRDVEDNSIIFLVTAKQQITRARGASQGSEQYVVTVARDGGSLKVYAFEPSDVGQPGGDPG